MHHFHLPSSFQTSAQVTITIDDVNDNAPVFKKASYQASVLEVSSMTNMKVSLIESVRGGHVGGVNNKIIFA